MDTIKNLQEWLANFDSLDQVGVDEGGLTLRVVCNDALTGDYYELGGIPELIEHAGTIPQRYEKAIACDPDELRLIVVRYGNDSGLVSIRAGTLLACAYETAHFSTPQNIRKVEIDDSYMTQLYGDEHSWNDVVRLLQEHYEWERGCLPTVSEVMHAREP